MDKAVETMGVSDGDHVLSPITPVDTTVRTGSPRGRARKSKKGAERAQQILEVAETLFQRQGYAQTSMDDIARAAGLLKGSLYYYIDSKEDLLFRIVDDVHAVSRAQLDAVHDLVDRSPMEKLVEFVERQVIYNARHFARVAVYHHEWHRLEGDRLKTVRRRRLEYERRLVELMEEAKQSGEIPHSMDARLAALSTLAVIVWPYTWYRSKDAATPEALARFCASYVRAALSSGTAAP